MRSYILCIMISLFALVVAPVAQAVVFQRLDNGLQVLIEPVHTAPVVLCSLWYKVGSSYEVNGTTGVSHLLEHLMFKGTKKYPAGALSQLVSGAGGVENAMTSSDYTVYYEKIPTSFLPKVLELEADRMQNLVFDQGAFNTEVEVVKEERRLRVADDPKALTLERYMAAAHINNPYHHPVIGWETDLNAMTLADAKDWYQKWYHPNNAVLVIVGDVKPKQVEAMVKKRFGAIKKHSLPVVKPRHELLGVGARIVMVERPAEQPWFVMGYHAPALPMMLDKDQWQAYALIVLAGVLNAGESGRLQVALVDKSRLATSVSVSYDPYKIYSGLFSVTATPAPGHDISDVKKAIAHQLYALQSDLVSYSTLEKVKAQVIAQDVFRKDSFMVYAMGLGRLVAAGLPWREDAAFVSHIRAVTPEQVKAVARIIFNNKNLTMAILDPKKESKNS